MSIHVLIVEENGVARNFLRRVVEESFCDELCIVECSSITGMTAYLPGSAPMGVELDPIHPESGNTPNKQSFDLVLWDLELPQSSIYLSAWSHLPTLLVVTTLYADDEHLFPALQAGAQGYLLKEDRFEVAVEELQRIAQGTPALSPGIARRLLLHFGGIKGRGVTDITPIGFAMLISKRLSPREEEALTYISRGFTVKEVASLMGIKGVTVNEYICAIYNKLQTERSEQN
jgi:two-component system, NarL family, nitrate/nitrite response regulator NarL